MARYNQQQHQNEINRQQKHKQKKKRAWSAATIIGATALLTMVMFAAVQWAVISSLKEVVVTSKQITGLNNIIGDSAKHNTKITNTESRRRQVVIDATTTTDHGDIKFIIFHKIQDGQGAGNLLHGLLATHLLGDEFQRVVCVSPHFREFHLAFEPSHPLAIEHCPDILERHSSEPPKTKLDQTLLLLNFGLTPVNECAAKEMLSSSKRVLHLVANTYPRWPRVPFRINFFVFYKAKKILIDALPYPHSEAPPIVVHLRRADSQGTDKRLGVKERDLRALGKLLPVDASQRSPFLVTNNVDWFIFFEQEYGWSHPTWEAVKHSALGELWAARQSDEAPPQSGERLERQQKYAAMRKEIGEEAFEYLQLWVDYYTLLRAKKVYHTYSDFSLSAVHWMHLWSRTYDGIDGRTGKMLLSEENWISDGETPRLADRPPDELRNCDAKVRVSY